MRNGFKMAMAGLGSMTMAQGCTTTETIELLDGHRVEVSESFLGTSITSSDGSINCFSTDPASEALRSCVTEVNNRRGMNSVELAAHLER